MSLQIQFITTQEDLQAAIAQAVNKAFSELPVGGVKSNEPVALIDTEELCKRLDVTEPTILRWRKKGKIPFKQLGAAIRFDYDAVLLAIDSIKKKGAKVV